MTRIDFIDKLLDLDPFQVVKADLDHFDAFVYVDLPAELDDATTDDDELCDLVDRYLEILQSYDSLSRDEFKELLTNPS